MSRACIANLRCASRGAEARLGAVHPELQGYISSVLRTSPPSTRTTAYPTRPPGRTRFDRLFHIGRTSTFLCVDALKAAVTEAKRGRDTDLYVSAIEALQQVAPDDPAAKIDKAWVESTRRSNKDETKRLEAELRGYKHNLVKESIRVSPGWGSPPALTIPGREWTLTWGVLDWQ